MDNIREFRNADYSNKIKDLESRLSICEESIQKYSLEINELKINFKNVDENLEKNNSLIKNISDSNIRTTVILETLNNNINKTSIDVKEISNKLNKIEIDNSKNNDSRITIKQIVVSLIISILMLLIGAGLALSGIKK